MEREDAHSVVVNDKVQHHSHASGLEARVLLPPREQLDDLLLCSGVIACARVAVDFLALSAVPEVGELDVEFAPVFKWHSDCFLELGCQKRLGGTAGEDGFVRESEIECAIAPGPVYVDRDINVWLRWSIRYLVSV